MAIVSYPAGILKHPLTVEAFSLVRQPDFTNKPKWTADPIARDAAIRQLNGREQSESQQMKATATHEVKLRYYPGLTPQHRLIWGARIFNIVSVDNVEEANVNHALRCREVI
jgi:SPP1 family predicted phage head-tail adaptor